MEENAKVANQDAQWLREDEQRVTKDIETLRSIRAGKKIEHGSLEYSEKWNAPSESAWQTAHSTGAMNYFEYAEAQSIADVYTQQELVTRQGFEIYQGHGRSLAPLFISNDPNSMTREEIELCLQRSADLLLDIHSLEQILSSLEQDYSDQLKRMR